MEMKVQDYAASRGVSAEAIRKKIRRNPPELEGHVVRRNNATWLDDVAQAYLDEGLQRNYGEVSDGSWQREKEMMQATITAQAKRISELADWHAENAMKIAAADQTQRLLTASQEETADVRRQLEDEQAAHEAALADANARAKAAEEKAAQVALEAAEAKEVADEIAADLREQLDEAWAHVKAAEEALQEEREKPWYKKLFGR